MIQHKCAICGKGKSGGASKKLSNGAYICSKGICRNLYNSNEDMISVYSLDMVLEVCKSDYQAYIRRK